MHRLSQVGEWLLHHDRQLVLINISKMVFVGLDKPLFYMAMAGKHGECRVQAIDVI